MPKNYRAFTASGPTQGGFPFGVQKNAASKVDTTRYLNRIHELACDKRCIVTEPEADPLSWAEFKRRMNGLGFTVEVLIVDRGEIL